MKASRNQIWNRWILPGFLIIGEKLLKYSEVTGEFCIFMILSYYTQSPYYSPLNITIMLDERGYYVREDVNSMELDDDQILLFLSDGRRTPQTPYEEELLQEIKALKSRGYGIDIPF